MSADSARKRAGGGRGIIFDLREMTTHDGPGIRTTVFFKGCLLRCLWCHNPEGIAFEPELMVRSKGCAHCGLCARPCGHPECAELGRCVRICPSGLLRAAGERVRADELAERLLKTADIVEEGGGGFTISGGEPLAQPAFLFELMELLKPNHLAIETSGFASPEVFERAIALADLVMLDLKHMDPKEHARGTGVENAPILANLERIMASGRRFVARIPLIPGFNDSEGNMRAVAERLAPAKSRLRVELLPCNPLAGAKYPMLGRRYESIYPPEAAPRVDLSSFDSLGIEALVL